MRLFVTGGAGHTGCNFLEAYLSDGEENCAVVLVRYTTDLKFLPKGFGNRLQLVNGDLRDGTASNQMIGCDAVMHIAHQTLCREVADAAARARVTRVFFVTTTGVFSKFNDLSAGYREIEDSIRQCGLNWTILRPTMIYGSERDVNVHKLLTYLSRHSVFPVFGSGRGLMQPVHVADLANGLLLALRNEEKTSMKEYNLCGRAPLTYNELLEASMNALFCRTLLVHIPHGLSLGVSRAAELLLRSRSPIKSEQIRRLSEDKAYNWSAAHKDFEYNPRFFADGVAQEVVRLRNIGIVA